MDVLQAMRVFARVIDSGSFTAAAQALGLSTAQVSRQVSDLESSLSARLLQRTTRRLRLTEVGERYLERCRQILGEVDEAAAEASGALVTPRGRLRLHSFTAMGTHVLVPLTASYAGLYPEVSLDLSLAQRNPDLLEEGYDVVIVHSVELPDSEMVAQRLGQMHSVFCAAPAYLQQYGIPREPEELRRHRCLRLLDPVSTAYSGDWVFERDGVRQVVDPGQGFQVNVSEAMVQAAVAGMGVCLLPNFVAAKALREGSLVRVLPTWRLHQRNIYALYSSRRFLDAKIRTWIEFMQGELPRILERDSADLDNPAYWA
ncbi:LysR family transcriptional regulator [Pseudomonas sp. GCM10022188]|uniref:LysR family transcriptional regulator n=1 Tax=Pseudomonas TaxID=286 RepID=UPI001E6314D1|nr:LysR family transcriptional regulator [Pseudomonas oryzagri]MCC6076313.1 LysR family transcriptional regulator [Pseudomonas oryzagri]